jgi:hypothetical protein
MRSPVPPQEWLDRIRERLVAAGRGLDSAAERGRTEWLALPLVMRQRLAAAAALAGLVAVVGLVLIPSAPCGLPGGDRCPPENDAIAIVPADVDAYLHLELDPGTDQYELAVPLVGRLPELSALVTGLLPLAADRRIDYQRDIRPWSGGEVAVAIDTEGADPARMLMLEVDDAAAALEFAEGALGPELATDELNGVTVVTDSTGTAAAIRAGFLLLGPESLVRRSVELPDSNSLAADGAARRALDELPDDRLAEAYVSPALAAALAESGDLAPLDAFVNSRASLGAAAALVVEEDAVGVAVRSVLDPERSESDPGLFGGLPRFEPTLTSRVKGDALVYLGVADPATAAAGLVGPAVSTAPEVFGGLSRFSRRLERRDGVDLGRDLLPRLQGEAALTVEPDEPPPAGGAEPPGDTPGVVGPTGAPYLALLAKGFDVPAVLDDLGRLEEPIAGAVDPGGGPEPQFEAREVGGIDAQVLPLSPVVDLTYAAIGDQLIVATSPGAIERYLADAEPLAGADSFERVTRSFDDQVSLLLYLGFRDLLALGERLFLAEDPTYARYAVDLRTLDAAALAVTQTPSELRLDARVTIGGGRPSG